MHCQYQVDQVIRFAFESQIDARSGTHGLNVSSIDITALFYI